MRREWTNEEVEYLRAHYREGVRACANALQRSLSSIENKLFKLGLYTRRVRTDYSLQYLQEHYSTPNGPQICADHLGLSLSQVKQMARGERLRLSRYDYSKLSSSFDYDSFSVNKAECCYMLGLLWADGSLDRRVRRVGITLVREDFLDVVSVFSTAKGWKWRDIIAKDRKPAIRARAHHQLFYEFLLDNDYLIKSGASAKKILAHIPNHFKHYWWRGYFDGDGWFNWRKALKYSFGICSCLGQNWDFFDGLALQLELKYYVSDRVSPKSSSSTVGCGSFDSVRKFGEFIYNGYPQDGLGLTRKYSSFVAMAKAKNIYVY